VWGWGISGLILKEWAISFNPTRKSQTSTKNWAILPNLPLVFWNETVLISIGNQIGKFLSCETGWAKKVERHWAQVQIEVDLKEGLMDEIELVWGEFKWVQKIDYWRVPFRCFGCHQVGHLQAECHKAPSHFSPFQKIWKWKLASEGTD
jgi:hypothetical protein